MARLPVVNSDDNQWGAILNDFLLQSHNSDGSLKISTDGTLSNKVDTTDARLADASSTNKGVVKLAGDLTGTASSPAIASNTITPNKVKTGSSANNLLTTNSGNTDWEWRATPLAVNLGGMNTATTPTDGYAVTYDEADLKMSGTALTDIATQNDFYRHETATQIIRTTNVTDSTSISIDSSQVITPAALPADYTSGVSQVLPTAAINYKKVFQNVTYSKAVFSLRFDDNPYTDYHFIYKTLLKYNLVGAFAVVRGKNDLVNHQLDAANLGNTTKLTRNQALEMQGHGMEIMCHSRTHYGAGTGGSSSSDPGYISGTDPSFNLQWDTFIDEFVTSTLELRSLGLWCDNFAPPGVWTGNSPYAFGGYDINGNLVNSYSNKSACDYGPAAQVARQYFAAVDGYFSSAGFFGTSDSLPALRRYGIGHTTGDNPNNYAGTTSQPNLNDPYTPSGDQTTKLTLLKNYVNDAIKFGGRGAFNFHSGGTYGAYIDASGTTQPTNWANLTNPAKQSWTASNNRRTIDSFLAYLAAQRDAGLIDVLTPTASAYATYSPTKINLCGDPYFKNYGGGSIPSCWSAPNTAPTYSGSGGNSGNGYVEISDSSHNLTMSLPARSLRSVQLDLYVKSADESPTKPKIIITAVSGATTYSTVTYPTDYDSFAVTDLNRTTEISGSSWTKVSITAGTHPSAKELKISLSNVDGGVSMQFSDVMIYQQ